MEADHYEHKVGKDFLNNRVQNISINEINDTVKNKNTNCMPKVNTNKWKEGSSLEEDKRNT